MSRIWQALKAAERERERNRAAQAGTPELPDMAELENSVGVAAEEEFPAKPALDEDRRKGLRHFHETSVLVYGAGADKQPFHEQSETIDANPNGCLITLANEVARGQRLVLTNMRNSAEAECRVVYVGRKSAGRGRVGVEFVKPAPGFWRMA